MRPPWSGWRCPKGHTTVTRLATDPDQFRCESCRSGDRYDRHRYDKAEMQEVGADA